MCAAQGAPLPPMDIRLLVEVQSRCASVPTAGHRTCTRPPQQGNGSPLDAPGGGGEAFLPEKRFSTTALGYF
ncbi:hypothetical protein GCM10009740_33020 [Terrabacter terrae]|uniref:Uncharacterized protein n=1 Tax=Terrabacter terrae TaxID=318434 RepID=A0ABN2UKN1_9MICO